MKVYGFQVFLAKFDIAIGTEWVSRVEEEIKRFDVFIVLLSKESIISDMVVEEIRRAKNRYDLALEHTKPKVIPIKIDSCEELGYDVDGYLRKFQYRTWRINKDTKTLIEEIAAITSKHSKDDKDSGIYEPILLVKHKLKKSGKMIPFEVPGGVVPIDSPFYITRRGEEAFIRSLLEENVLLKIFAPRQYGKTSILARIMNLAYDNSYYVASLNFQLLDLNDLKNLDRLLTQLCISCAESAKRPHHEFTASYNEIWKNKFQKNPKRKCDKFFEEYLLNIIDKPLVLAIDEADRLFPHKVISLEFFSLLRVWSEQSKLPGKGVFKKLKIIVVHSTEASLAIPDSSQSPFNTGKQFDAFEFTREEIIKLTALHGLALTKIQLNNLISLIGGHPYLIRKALYCLATKEYEYEDLVKKCYTENGPFGDHLRRQYWNLYKREGYLRVIKNIILKNGSYDKEACDKLFAAGLINGDVPLVSLKNELYEKYFKIKLNIHE